MPITNGSLEYERRVTTGDYQHRSAKATISWIVPEGPTGETVEWLLSRAEQLALSQVHRAIGLAVATSTEKAVTGPSATAATSTTAKTPEPNAPATPRGRKPKDTTAASPVAASVDTQQPTPAVAPTTADPAAIEEDVLQGPSEAALDKMLGVEPAPALPDVTDMDLQKFVQSKVAALLKADDAAHNTAVRKAVTTLIRSYADGVSMIPKDKRHEFLDKLKDLKP